MLCAVVGAIEPVRSLTNIVGLGFGTASPPCATTAQGHCTEREIWDDEADGPDSGCHHDRLYMYTKYLVLNFRKVENFPEELQTKKSYRRPYGSM